ncbi:MAG: hypothetical protein AMJ46_11910 [Latescibacteria bacterium DG_63]|nr:MAG: hypothetical protein AMJ46_11910 [Latescibacteria bacterium DG_63]
MLSNLKRRAIAALAFLSLLVLTLALSAGSAFSKPGPTLFVEKVDENSGFLTVTFTAKDLFSPRIVETLARGLPATLSYEMQLWKERKMWFDKLLWVNRLSYRVKYDPWEDGFLIETREGVSPALFELEHVKNSLCWHVKGRLGSVRLVEPYAVHYVVVRATLKLLSPEDMSEVESWLSEGNEDRRGGITAVPGYLFDMIVGLSGFGDEAASGRSAPFRRGEFSGEGDAK